MRHAAICTMLMLAASLAAADAPTRAVPDLIGMTPDQATAASRKAGFPPPSIVAADVVAGPGVTELEPCFNGSRVGVVCSQAPAAGERADATRPLELLLGGEATEPVIVMPELGGLTLEQAIAALKTAGFTSRPGSNFADRCKHGLVCGQRWPAGMKVRKSTHQVLDLGP